MAGVLSCGLGENSRIKKKMNNRSVDIDTMILSAIYDKVALLVWKDTKDGQKGVNRPVSLLNAIVQPKKESNTKVFSSIEEYEKARKEIFDGNRNSTGLCSNNTIS